jgi:hypothetical protein
MIRYGMIQDGKEQMTMWAKGSASIMEHTSYKIVKTSKPSGETKKVGN